jgi:inorganic pyrophosphatase
MIDATTLLGKQVTVTIDRPIGSSHPRHTDIIYPLNYGYIADILAGDGMEIDAYVLGPTLPCISVSGTVIAVVERIDDVEDKLVVVADDRPENHEYTVEQIRTAVDFQERYFASTIVLWKG